MQQLQQLGDMLADIHSQHEHQSLLRKETHRKLVDEYASAGDLAIQVDEHFREWHKVEKKLSELMNRSDELLARKDLLSFQVNELKQLDLDPSVLKKLETEQQTLANAEQILQDSHSLLAICDQTEGFNIRDGLKRALAIFTGLKHKPEALVSA